MVFTKIVTVQGVHKTDQPAKRVVQRLEQGDGLVLFNGYGSNPECWVNPEKVTKVYES